MAQGGTNAFGISDGYEMENMGNFFAANNFYFQPQFNQFNPAPQQNPGNNFFMGQPQVAQPQNGAYGYYYQNQNGQPNLNDFLMNNGM